MCSNLDFFPSSSFSINLYVKSENSEKIDTNKNEILMFAKGIDKINPKGMYASKQNSRIFFDI